MKRNHIVVFINRKDEIEMKTRCVLSIFPLGKGKIIVSGHIRQVSITIKRLGGRRRHADNKVGSKKAGILSIEKFVNPALFVVKCSKVRYGRPLDIPMISFGWDKKVDRFVYMDVKCKEDKKLKSTNSKNNSASIFEKVNLLAFCELADAIADMMEVKLGTGNEYIRYMREKAIIEQLADQTYQLKIF